MIRRIAATAVLTAAFASLAGCQQVSETAAAQAPAEVAGEYALHYLDFEDSARLAYGVEGSDQVKLMLECGKGSGEVELSDVSTGDSSLRLSSGGVEAQLAGTVEAGVAPTVFVTTATDSPVMTAFRRTGEVTVGAGSARYVVEEKAGGAVERFFTACQA